MPLFLSLLAAHSKLCSSIRLIRILYLVGYVDHLGDREAAFVGGALIHGVLLPSRISNVLGNAVAAIGAS